MPRRLSSRAAFTLIEILVVVAIIGILAALLFPVFGRARDNGRRASCQSNLKQYGLGVTLYLQDFDERYPIGLVPIDLSASPPEFLTVSNLLEPYTKSTEIGRCPSDTDKVDIDFSENKSSRLVGVSNDQWGRFSYGGNDLVFRSPVLYELGGLDPVAPALTAEIADSSRLPLIYEAANHEALEPTSPYNPQAFPPFIQVEKRHFGGANCLFADGHVKWYKEHPDLVDPANSYPLHYWNVPPDQKN